MTVTRVANLAPGGVLAVVGVGGLAEDGDWSSWPVMLPVWATAGFLLVRAWRMQVARVAGTVVVRGHLWTRRVPAAAITSVSDFPALHWRSDGSRRLTPLWMFWTSARTLAPYTAHAEREVGRLRTDLGVGLVDP